MKFYSVYCIYSIVSLVLKKLLFSSFCVAYIFFFSLSKCLDNAQSFLGYILLTKPSCRLFFFLQHDVHIHYKRYGAPFVKILYQTDLAQKLLSLRAFSYLCTFIAKSACIYSAEACRRKTWYPV